MSLKKQGEKSLGEVGQAVVLDALFFLTICTIASSALIWASSMYGEKAYQSYSYMALDEYESGVLRSLSELEYEYHGASTTTKKQWMVELGGYMKGEFDKNSPEWGNLTREWNEICLQAPHPMELTIQAEDQSLPNDRRSITMACPLNPLKPSGPNITDLVANYSMDPSVAGAPPEAMGRIPPYYSTDPQTKICGAAGGCVMQVKIYY